MKVPNLFFTLLFLVMLAPGIQAMGLIGTTLKDIIYFQPGLERSYDYVFTTNSGFTEDYELYARMENSELDLTPGVTLDKYYVKDVPSGQAIPFSVHLTLPDKIETPGIYEIRAGARETQVLGQGTVGVRTAAEARYIIIVLCPFLCAETSFDVPNANVNDTLSFIFTVQNLGEEPVLARGRVEVYDQGLLKGVARTEEAIVPSTETFHIPAPFATTGLPAGSYTVIGTLDLGDKNTTTYNKSFQIGTKNAYVTDYTRAFRKDAINKMAITARSGWNGKMKNLYAEVGIIDGGREIIRFKTTPSELDAWWETTLLGYFDTTGLSYRNYTARISLYADGLVGSSEGEIEIKEGATTEVVTAQESPAKKDIPWVIIGLLSFIGVMLIVFVILLILVFRKKAPSLQQQTMQPPSLQPPIPPGGQP